MMHGVEQLILALPLPSAPIPNIPHSTRGPNQRDRKKEIMKEERKET